MNWWFHNYKDEIIKHQKNTIKWKTKHIAVLEEHVVILERIIDNFEKLMTNEAAQAFYDWIIDNFEKANENIILTKEQPCITIKSRNQRYSPSKDK